jgi:PAS domain S-box-containing protein
VKLTQNQWFDRLRTLAEEMTKDRESDLPDGLPGDMASLINEIQVYQAELEIQNEELRSAQEEVKRAHDRFFDLFQMAPAGYLVLDHASMIADANQTFCDMVGRDRQQLIGRPVSELILPADQSFFYSRYTSFYRKPEGKILDFRFVNTKKGEFHARLRGRFLALNEKADDTGTSRLFIAVTDITEEKQAKNREQHAQRVLRAIRSITQMIASQKDPADLIHLACSQLTRSMGYYSAWIALLDPSGHTVLDFAASGANVDFSGLEAQLDRGVFPACMRTALLDNERHVVMYPATECAICPLQNNYSDCAAFVQRIEYEGNLIGLLSVAVPRSYTHHHQEKELFSELVRDLAFALNGIEVARAFRRASGIIERSPAVAFVWKNEAGWPVEYVSKNCHSLFHRPVEQFFDQEVSYAGLIHPDDRERVFEEVATATADTACDRLDHLPYRILQPDDTPRWVQDITYLKRDSSGNVTHYEGIVQDISEKKANEDIVNMFFEQPLNLHLVAGVDGTIQKVNEGWHTLLGYTCDELENRPFLDLVHPDDIPATVQEMQSLAEGRRTFYFENRYRHKNGDYHILAWSASAPQGNDKLFAVASDITDQKAAERSLEKAHQEMEAVYETAMVGIMVLHSRVITSVNRRMAEMLGYQPEEMTGREPEQLHLSHEHFIEFGEKYYWQLAEKDIVQVEYPLRHKSGKTVLCQFNGRAISPPDLALGAVWVIDDITARKRMEKRLLQNKKGESLARMAASVAHHFNNILMATIGNLEIALEDIPAGHPAAKNVGGAERSAKRAATLSRRMLTYLGQDSRKDRIVDVAELCRERIAKMVENQSIPLKLKTEIESQHLPIQADETQLEQVLEVLWDNAVEAVAEDTEGEIQIAVKKTLASDIPGHHIFPVDFSPVDTDYACIGVTDTGPGIEDKKMELIFDPFYSDKFTGRGLGLAVALGIVKAHNGCIAVSSVVGQQTSFVVFLPLSTNQNARQGEYQIPYLSPGE